MSRKYNNFEENIDNCILSDTIELPIIQEDKTPSLIIQESDNIVMPRVSPLATQLRVAFNNTYNESKLDIMHATPNVDMFRSGLLFERADQRMPSCVRLLLYEQTSYISLSVSVYSLYYSVAAFLRECVCMSTVIVLSNTKEVNEDQQVLFLFVEFSPGQDMFLLDGYINTIRDIRADCLNWMWKHMFPNIKDNIQDVLIPYDPTIHKLFVILDLDKTLFLSDADSKEEQRHAFISDFEIAGNMAITNERFQHHVMIRPGCHWFLWRLQQIAEIFVVTAGDLHYARNAVIYANARNWISSKDTNNEEHHQNVSIPLSRVFSVRNQIKRAAPKTFERALPFAPFMTQGAGCAVLVVDDDPGAWDVSVRRHVIPISPFQPLNNSHEHLLRVVQLIEQASQNFFNYIYTNINKMTITDDTKISFQFFDSGRYIVFSSGLVVDCSNGISKNLDSTELLKFNNEHTIIGEPHTLETTSKVPTYIHFFEDGRYVLIATEDKSSFVIFKYGGIMHFPTIAALDQFLLTVKSLRSPYIVSNMVEHNETDNIIIHDNDKTIKKYIKDKRIIDSVQNIINKS
jgi:hypothetical protein